MRAYTTTARDRGVTTIPVALRESAGVRTDTEIVWVEIEPQLWLVGPAARRPEEVAPVVASCLLSEESPFPKLMQKLASGAVPLLAGRGRPRSYRPAQPPALTEEQMVALGKATSKPRWRRGSR